MSDDLRNTAYSRPPIIEATIELRFLEAISAAKLKKASDRIAGRYAGLSSEEQIEAHFNFAQRSADFNSVSPLFRHTSDDQANILLLQNRSVTWTRLAPYEGWAMFLGRMKEEFAALEKAWGMRASRRLGMRYVNRIDVPRSDDQLFHNEHYIAYRLEVGPLLDPQNGYQWLVRKEHIDKGLVSIVQSAMVEPEIPGTMAFTLDIDVAIDVDVPSKRDDILAKLEEMRLLKNEIFEAGITPLAREKFA